MSKSNFYQDVYQLVKLIPRGKVTTYGAIAKYLGLKSSARMVGWALNQSIAENTIPAHRVVNRNGRLTGKMHFARPELMQELLELENVKIENDQVVDFSKHFWDPSRELEL